SIRLGAGRRGAHPPPRRDLAAASAFPHPHRLSAARGRGLQYSESAAVSAPRLETDRHGGRPARLLAAPGRGAPLRSAGGKDGLVRLESPGGARDRRHGSRRRARRGGGAGSGALAAVPPGASFRAGDGGRTGGGGSPRQAGASRRVPHVGAPERPAVEIPVLGGRAHRARPAAGARSHGRRAAGPHDLRLVLGVQRSALRAPLAAARRGRRGAGPRPGPRPPEGMDGDVGGLEPHLSLSLSPAPRQAPAGRRRGRGRPLLAARARPARGNRPAVRPAAPALGHGLSLVRPLGAPLGGPAPREGVARALGAVAALVPRPPRRAGLALGVWDGLGAVHRAGGGRAVVDSAPARALTPRPPLPPPPSHPHRERGRKTKKFSVPAVLVVPFVLVSPSPGVGGREGAGEGAGG